MKSADSLARGLLLVLPVAAVGVVLFGLLVVARPRPSTGVRVWGGPTDTRFVSFRFTAVRLDEDGERPLGAARATVTAVGPDGAAQTWAGALDAEGAASPRFELPSGVARLRFEVPPAPAVDAPVSVPAAAWARRATRRGGWATGRAREGLVVRAAAERGVFSVPFPDPLVVEVRQGGAPLAGVLVQAKGEGASVTPAEATTNIAGRVRFTVSPSDHSASVTLVARAEGRAESRLEVTPGVVPGAFHASVGPEGLVVRSPIARERAYVALVTEKERLFSATVLLASDGRGGAVGTLALPALPAARDLYAVVSSESDLHSAAAVGWPIGAPAADGEPPRTFDVPDAPWVDTVPSAIRREHRRQRGVRVLTAVSASFFLSLTALLVAHRARRAGAELALHVARNTGDDSAARIAAPSGRWVVAAAVFSLVLGVALLAAFLFVL